MIIATTFATAAFSQAVPAAKETGRAVAESSKEAGDNIKAATSKEPMKSYN
jgi:mRNA degradation ribonuclease J1/J2